MMLVREKFHSEKGVEINDVVIEAVVVVVEV
jgi:hypothetical protein